MPACVCLPWTVAAITPPNTFSHPKNQRLLWPAATPELSIQCNSPSGAAFRSLGWEVEGRELVPGAGSARPLLCVPGGVLLCSPDKSLKHSSFSLLILQFSPLLFLSGSHCPSFKYHPAAIWKPHPAHHASVNSASSTRSVSA